MASSGRVIEFNHLRINLKDERLVFEGFSIIHSFFSFPNLSFQRQRSEQQIELKML